MTAQDSPYLVISEMEWFEGEFHDLPRNTKLMNDIYTPGSLRDCEMLKCSQEILTIALPVVLMPSTPRTFFTDYLRVRAALPYLALRLASFSCSHLHTLHNLPYLSIHLPLRPSPSTRIIQALPISDYKHLTKLVG